MSKPRLADLQAFREPEFPGRREVHAGYQADFFNVSNIANFTGLST
jgi:hypothetical protein